MLVALLFVVEMKDVIKHYYLLFCGLTTKGFGQADSKIENIKKLLELTGAGRMGVQAAESMLTSFKTSYKEVPEEFWIDFKKELNPAAPLDLYSLSY